MNLHAKFGVSSSYSLWDLDIKRDRRTDRQAEGHGYIDSAVDADQAYIYFMGSVTPPSACYAHFIFFGQT